MADMTTGDLALMRDDGFGGNNSFMWIFALLLRIYGGNGMGFGGGGRFPMYPPDVATNEAVTAGLNNQATQAQLQQIALSSANNNYETARLIQTQTGELVAQNNTNLINAIQGFNQVNLGIQNQTNVLSQQLQALQAKLDSCCCEIKTQMLNDKLAETQAKNVAMQNDISNYNQSQYLLGQMGRFVAWAGSGSQAPTTGT